MDHLKNGFTVIVAVVITHFTEQLLLQRLKVNSSNPIIIDRIYLKNISVDNSKTMEKMP